MSDPLTTALALVDPLPRGERRSLLVRGYINYEFAEEHYPAFLTYVSKGIADGQLRYREDLTVGLENAPAAFMGMLTGKNFGKALVPELSYFTLFAPMIIVLAIKPTGLYGRA